MIPASLLMGFLIALFLEQILSKSKEIFLGKPRIPRSADEAFEFRKEAPKSSKEGIEVLKDLYMSQEAEAPFFSKEKKQERIISSENYNGISDFDSRIKEMKKITKIIQQDKYPNFPEMPVRETKKSGAPENLPIADGFPEEHQKVSQQEKPRIETNREPTAEELRERLNRLLRGEL